MKKRTQDINFVFGVVTGAVMVLLMVWLAGCTTVLQPVTKVYLSTGPVIRESPSFEPPVVEKKEEKVNGCVVTKEPLEAERSLDLCKI